MSTELSRRLGEVADDSLQSDNLPALSAGKEQQLLSVFGDVAAPQLHTFQGTPKEVWGQIAKVSAAECLGYDDLGEQPFGIQHFYVHGVQIAGPTPGEIIPALRCVLIPREGKPVAFVSDGIARDLAGIIRTFGMGPYLEPIAVRVVKVKTRKGFTTYRLVPAD